jgi:hypothetical protein
LEKDIKKMINWRQIFSYRTEPELPNGFGRPISGRNTLTTYWVGVCLYQDPSEEYDQYTTSGKTYAYWSDKLVEYGPDFDNEVKVMKFAFDVHREEYLEDVKRILLIPEKDKQHQQLCRIAGGSNWLDTSQVRFLD